ncbi:hypothetical protein N7326_08935 [Corynebacterium sp. ES2794-CONJ1]|uniref:hypothetical protein n=1 Tax=Corynebacterium sp. ES2794-CONJ1 TaxID=2980553 RepID=UPI0021DA0B22|nr:hypothetical protein [Corynebacterium sp. ES2794-CONJ1]MCU9519982.1 hypothetical protein [Corynebacterium sp. ES2794-CONJ1]
MPLLPALIREITAPFRGNLTMLGGIQQFLACLIAPSTLASATVAEYMSPSDGSSQRRSYRFSESYYDYALRDRNARRLLRTLR